jgi:hypothetical protein
MKRHFVSGLQFVFQEDQRKRKWQSDIQRHLWSKSRSCPKNNLDLVFQCRDGQVAAHKLLLRTTSPVINVTVDLDQNEVHVLVPDFSIRTVRKSLELIYTGSIDLDSGREVDRVMDFCCQQLAIDMMLDWNLNEETLNQDKSLEKQNCRNSGLSIEPVTSNPDQNAESDLSVIEDKEEEANLDLSIIEDKEEEANLDRSVVEAIAEEANLDLSVIENAEEEENDKSIILENEDQENESIIEEIETEKHGNQTTWEVQSNTSIPNQSQFSASPKDLVTISNSETNSGNSLRCTFFNIFIFTIDLLEFQFS